ncbi:YqgE/AlgH family protein [Pseudoruegeria sp. SK021]|uniref:YqgE/AlgH family protein n=1 Tax=Pseudoruegeria sp. SK021 TaxID=1933035 RepID=UPI000A247521|nr:YqgE/AlgH family protein [Pseudoruegeria sp. SK021]OSP55753.1 hypothetical protein BV911_06025 [Pseudoruegeria sp. SK021]
MNKVDTIDLTGKLLIAMPGMTDPRFEKSVIFICAYSEDGAMGLVVNKPARDIRFSDLLDQLSIEMQDPSQSPPIHFGGPVEHGRGFVLHSSDYTASEATLQVDRRFGMTATLDVLEDISRGDGPTECLLALGYAGWGPGQLDDEISSNAWLISDATADLVFSTDSDSKWGGALGLLGIDPISLSSTSGRA